MARTSLMAITTILSLTITSMPAMIGQAEAEGQSSSSADQRFLRDGGAVRLPTARQPVERQRRGDVRPDGELHPASGIDQLSGGSVLEDAREDNLNTSPDIYSTDEEEEFFEDGGTVSISSEQPRIGYTTLQGANTSGHWRHVVVQPVNLSHRGSFSFITSDVGTEPGNRGSTLSLTSELSGYTSSVQRLGTQPKIINVQRERLDRRPMPSSGIETIYTGGSKIIRISASYRNTAYDVTPANRRAR